MTEEQAILTSNNLLKEAKDKIYISNKLSYQVIDAFPQPLDNSMDNFDVFIHLKNTQYENIFIESLEDFRRKFQRLD